MSVTFIPDPLLNSHYSVCPKPCKTLTPTVSKRLSTGFKQKNLPLRNLVFNFDPVASVRRTIPKMTMLDVINDIGSSMGLWLGLGVAQVTFKMR